MFCSNARYNLTEIQSWSSCTLAISLLIVLSEDMSHGNIRSFPQGTRRRTPTGIPPIVILHFVPIAQSTVIHFQLRYHLHTSAQWYVHIITRQTSLAGPILSTFFFVSLFGLTVTPILDLCMTESSTFIKAKVSKSLLSIAFSHLCLLCLQFSAPAHPSAILSQTQSPLCHLH